MCYPEVLGESRSIAKQVMWSDIVQLKVIEDDSDMLHFKQLSYNSDYKKCKFKSNNTRHVEMNRIAKRQM